MQAEKKMLSILLLTDMFPYGTGESFLDSEILFLSKNINNLVILPLENSNKAKKRALPNGVVLLDAPFNSVKNKGELLLKGIFNQSPLFPFIKELFRGKVLLSFNRIKNWLIHFLVVRASLSYLKSKPIENYDILYFYWGLRWSQVLTFLDKHNQIAVVRFHGSDLYEERNFNYIPFRGEQLKKIDLAVFVSEMGKNYLLNAYPGYLKQVYVSRLGTPDFGVPAYNKNNRITKIISCSTLVPLKQTNLLAKSLLYLKNQVEWDHVGDGPMKKEILDIIINLGGNVKVTLHGHIDREELFKLYQKNQFDVFINCSTSEGVPVSIMEALSFGIPVIATDVGGTKEIVDDEVGLLISHEISPLELAKIIEDFLSRKNYLQLRENARKRWLERCNGETLYLEFIQKLISIKK